MQLVVWWKHNKEIAAMTHMDLSESEDEGEVLYFKTLSQHSQHSHLNRTVTSITHSPAQPIVQSFNHPLIQSPNHPITR